MEPLTLGSAKFGFPVPDLDVETRKLKKHVARILKDNTH